MQLGDEFGASENYPDSSGWDGYVPPEDYAPDDFDIPQPGSNRTSNAVVLAPRPLQQVADEVLGHALAACHKATVKDLRALATAIGANEAIERYVSLDRLNILRTLFDALDAEVRNASNETEEVDFTQLTYKTVYSDRLVVEELNKILAIAEVQPSDYDQRIAKAHEMLVNLDEQYSHEQARDAAQSIIHALDDRQPNDDIRRQVDLLKAPFSLVRDANGYDWPLTIDEIDEISQSRDSIRALFPTTGIPMLDESKSETEDLSVMAPGQIRTVVADTGNGKTTLVSFIERSCMLSMPDSFFAHVHTEEHPVKIAKRLGVTKGLPYERFRQNLRIVETGGSLTVAVEKLFRVYWDMYDRAQQTGTWPNLGLVVVDHNTGFRLDDGREMIRVLMEGMKSGIAEGNLGRAEEIFQVDFAQATGHKIPTDLGDLSTSVLMVNQLKMKVDKAPTFINERKTPIGNYTLIKGDGSAAWPVAPGDRRLPEAPDIFGAQIVQDHSHDIWGLRRARIMGNEAVWNDSIGEYRLMNNQAQIIDLKSRTSSSGFTDLICDIRPVAGVEGEGLKLKSNYEMYFACRATVQAIEAGRVDPRVFRPDVYHRPGDPMLPRRPVTSVLPDVTYVPAALK